MTPVTDLPLESAVNDDEILDKSNELSKSVCLPGCLLAQTLLKYTVAKPKRLTASICAQPDDQLHAWAQHAMLSRVLEALLQSTSVSFKHKSRLISSFQPILTTLALDRYGSHVVEAIWLATDGVVEPLLLKEQIAEQLVGAHQRLRVHRYGHFLYYKLNLGMFVDNKPLWRRRILKLEKRAMDSINPGLDGFVHPTLVYFTDVVIRLMPGKMFARFLASHVLNSGADEAQLPTPICLMPAHTVASYALRAILKRIKRPGDVRELFTALCQNIETMGSSYGLGSALKTKQHALINDLAVLCGKTEFSEMQKMFLHVSPLISIFLTYCSWSP
ncbi:hypothetical protein FBUS_03852 [Fasciolopsis buskii]|uniref:Uncharacterized protein n=1 Tax=Fasciolopsis buskii TaxID=27845 RepID=A0A8E0VDB6_9TREM|nr:hypothetical protein FBUS_03852 [Fasciolopsis buski]